MAEEVLQTQITKPSPIIEEAQQKYLTALFDQSAPEQKLDTSQFAPNVVGKTALDQAVQQQAAKAAGLGELQFGDQGQVTGIGQDGVASFQPYLTTAEGTLGDVQQFITGAAGRTGPTAYQAFESPYQTAVRDATLAQFDEQAAIRQQAIKDQQAQLGVLGSGRAGVQTAEYQRKSDMDRALFKHN